MKIAVPAIRATEVGRIIHRRPSRLYNDPGRPNVYGLTSVTVFDRDLRVAGRSKAAVQGVAFSALVVAACVVVLPLSFAGLVLSGVAKAAANLMDRATAAIGLDPWEGIVPTLRRLVREVVR